MCDVEFGHLASMAWSALIVEEQADIVCGHLQKGLEESLLLISEGVDIRGIHVRIHTLSLGHERHRKVKLLDPTLHDRLVTLLDQGDVWHQTPNNHLRVIKVYS